MADTALQLITGAYHASGVIGREFDTVGGMEASEGLEWLNDILSEKTVDQTMVPYESTFNFNFEIGKEKYFIPDLITIDTFVFFFNGVRFAVGYTKRNAYFGSPRVQNINALPYQWYFERQLGGGNLYVYFQPQSEYPCEIHGIFRMPQVTLMQDLSLSLDRFYLTYLRYALAERICSEYAYNIPPNVTLQLSKYTKWIASQSRLMDLRMTKSSTLSGQGGYNWAQINISPGYIVG